tara:strand:+ start:7806 stop:9161 length:1356 start_codon:yes stop_codon:yes gene_type:complete
MEKRFNLSNTKFIGFILIVISFVPLLSYIGIIFGSFLISFLILYKKKIDISDLFILLFPFIAFASSDNYANYQNEVSNIGIITYIFYPHNLINANTSFLIGPINVSVALVAVFAIFFRVNFNFFNSDKKFLILLWNFAILISIIGFFLAEYSGSKSPLGNTVAIRGILSLGVFFLPLNKLNTLEFNNQISFILKVSLFFCTIGLIGNHWVYVVYAFPAIFILTKSEIIWKILSFVLLLKILILGVSYTSLSIVFFSFLLVYMHAQRKKRFMNYFFSKKIILWLYVLFPLLFITLLVYLLPTVEYYFEGTNFFYKLVYDRLAHWLSAWNLIKESNYLIVPVGRDYLLQNAFLFQAGDKLIGYGAHNYFLQVALQGGVIFATIYFTILFYFLMNLYANNSVIESDIGRSLIFSLLGVYLAMGLAGNQFFTDSTGLMFWLIISQAYNMTRSIKN